MTEFEIANILDENPTYEEFLASAEDLSGNNPRFMTTKHPNLIRLAKAIILEEVNPGSHAVWKLKEEIGTDDIGDAHYDLMMNAKMLRLSDEQVEAMKYSKL